MCLFKNELYTTKGMPLCLASKKSQSHVLFPVIVNSLICLELNSIPLSFNSSTYLSWLSFVLSLQCKICSQNDQTNEGLTDFELIIIFDLIKNKSV